MIDRRRLLLTLAALAAAPARVLAETRVDGRVLPEDRNKILRNVPDTPTEEIPNFRRYMREIVMVLGDAAHKRNLQLLVRNGPELLIKERLENDWEALREPTAPHINPGQTFPNYLAAIDGMVIDGLFYGHETYGVMTDKPAAAPFWEAAGALLQAKKSVFSIEYAKEPKVVDDLRKHAADAKIVSYLDQDGNMALANIPKTRPDHENPAHVTKLADARNWLPLFNADSFPDRQSLIDRLTTVGADLLVIDPFWRKEALTKADVKALKTKPFGSTRLVYARLPVGIASTKRWYWQNDWKAGLPPFLRQPIQDDPTGWLTEYWNDDWKSLLGKYFTGLADLGFDGFLLDSVDAYILFEEEYPIN